METENPNGDIDGWLDGWEIPSFPRIYARLRTFSYLRMVRYTRRLPSPPNVNVALNARGQGEAWLPRISIFRRKIRRPLRFLASRHVKC